MQRPGQRRAGIGNRRIERYEVADKRRCDTGQRQPAAKNAEQEHPVPRTPVAWPADELRPQALNAPLRKVVNEPEIPAARRAQALYSSGFRQRICVPACVGKSGPIAVYFVRLRHVPVLADARYDF